MPCVQKKGGGGGGEEGGFVRGGWIRCLSVQRSCRGGGTWNAQDDSGERWMNELLSFLGVGLFVNNRGGLKTWNRQPKKNIHQAAMKM